MNYTLRNLLIAAGLMLVGLLAVTSFIRGERQSLSRGKQEIQVFVAAKDIPPGTSAKELETGGYLDTMDVLREDAPPTAIGKLSDIAKGDVVNDKVYAGEMLTGNAFDDTAGLKPTSQIKGNERLFAVPVAAANDAAGLVRQGDFIDIYAAVPANGGGAGKAASVVARDIEVIETPETLAPKGLEVEQTAPTADGDTKLYVLKGTDEEALNIKVALANAQSESDGLMFLVRGATGPANSHLTTQTNLDPTVH